MKKFLTTALLGLMMTTSLFANSDKGISNSVKSNFKYDFKNAENVTWSKTASFPTATFVLNNKRTNAFYDNYGQLIGTSQAITMDQLPTSAKRVFLKKYLDYTVTEAIEFVGKDESAYFISAKNDNNSIVFKVADGEVSIFK